MIGPSHKSFATMGGFQHIYANEAAMNGYRTRIFPDGSVIAFDWLEMTEKDGSFLEGPRRQLDVMVKDSKRFSSTGGWGFQRFVKGSKTEHAASPTPQECFACHDRWPRSKYLASVVGVRFPSASRRTQRLCVFMSSKLKDISVIGVI